MIGPNTPSAIVAIMAEPTKNPTPYMIPCVKIVLTEFCFSSARLSDFNCSIISSCCFSCDIFLV